MFETGVVQQGELGLHALIGLFELFEEVLVEPVDLVSEVSRGVDDLLGVVVIVAVMSVVHLVGEIRLHRVPLIAPLSALG
jgi:hypothetical protein